MTQSTDTRHEATVVVGMGTCGLAAGASRIHDAFAEKLVARDDVRLKKTGCIGSCTEEPLVDIIRPGWPRLSFRKVTPEDVDQLLDLAAGASDVLPTNILLGAHAAPGEDTTGLSGVPVLWDLPFFSKQRRQVLKNAGLIDPESLEEYLATGGYRGFERALQMTPEEVIQEVREAGLRGRGGAGFPTGLKWEFARRAEGEPKYVICNADEGDPGAFMDRSILEGDPHLVIEGLAAAAYAIGAEHGYVYCRAEYPLAIARLTKAIEDAREAGYLGKNILDSGFDFDVAIKKGAGAFVCGEETALIASIEGRRGMPRPRPPYPAQSGLWGKPTNINNVETLANVPHILSHGARTFRQEGTQDSPGTKVFALAGKIERGGLVEVPMGMTLRQIIEDVGGGVQDGGQFKAIQIGGPSGGCVPEDLLDTPVDYDSLSEVGTIMGSGGMLVMDENTCMVEIARFFMGFAQNESCGKCVLCREGTRRMMQILDRIVSGDGTKDDMDLLEELAAGVAEGSLCGLGKTAPNPVLSTLRSFRTEYDAHVYDGRCPAGICKGLMSYWIDPELCRGCTKCQTECAVGCIHGQPGEVFEIDATGCLQCGACVTACPFAAIKEVS